MDISTSLPDIPVNDIEKDKFGNLFIATDVGVLASKDEGLSWVALGENLPSVVVPDLFIHEGSEYLYAATFGRSMYKIDISNNILATTQNEFASEVKVFPNPASDFVTVSIKDKMENPEIKMYDIMGKLVKQEQFESGNNLQFSVSNLSKGIYYLQISSNGKEMSKKLIIK